MTSGVIFRKIHGHIVPLFKHGTIASGGIGSSQGAGNTKLAQWAQKARAGVDRVLTREQQDGVKDIAVGTALSIGGGVAAGAAVKLSRAAKLKGIRFIRNVHWSRNSPLFYPKHYFVSTQAAYKYGKKMEDISRGLYRARIPLFVGGVGAGSRHISRGIQKVAGTHGEHENVAKARKLSPGVSFTLAATAFHRKMNVKPLSKAFKRAVGGAFKAGM